jgi:RNA polymerase sigma-70 factor (ECF subfamily)
VFQDVFQAVAAHITTFRKDRPGDSFRGWLRTITQNKIHDHFRRRGREPGGVGGTEAQIRLSRLPAGSALDGEDSSHVGDEHLSIRHLLSVVRGEFEERTWQAFWMTTVEGRLPGDVATDLAMSPGAVRVAKSRVLRRLREELGEA